MQQKDHVLMRYVSYGTSFISFKYLHIPAQPFGFVDAILIGIMTYIRTLDMPVQCTGVYGHVRFLKKSLNYARTGTGSYGLLISSLFLG